MSLTARMVSAAIFCARAAPSASTASIAAGSPCRRRISAAIGLELCHRQLDQRRLEGGELRVAEFLEHAGARRAGERGVDADQIVGFRAASPALSPRSAAAPDRSCALADLLRDGVGVVGEVDARLIGGVRLRHFLGAVAQRHDARRRAGDQRLGQREERVAEAVRCESNRPKSLLNFWAMSRDSSRCCFWSSPTGTWVAR